MTPSKECTQPQAPKQACTQCTGVVHTCANPAGPNGDYTCPVHPYDMEDEDGKWFCSSACWYEFQIDALVAERDTLKARCYSLIQNVPGDVLVGELRAAAIEMEQKLAERDTLKARLEAVNIKDSAKTREINILVDEDKRLRQQLSDVQADLQTAEGLLGRWDKEPEFCDFMDHSLENETIAFLNRKGKEGA